MSDTAVSIPHVLGVFFGDDVKWVDGIIHLNKKNEVVFTSNKNQVEDIPLAHFQQSLNGYEIQKLVAVGWL